MKDSIKWWIIILWIIILGVWFWLLSNPFSMKWEIMSYCYDWQFTEWLEMFTWEVLYEKWDYLVVSWYYQFSDMWWKTDCDNEWNCYPAFRIVQSWYTEEVFAKEYCIRKDPVWKYKDMIEKKEQYDNPKYTLENCKEIIKKDWKVWQKWWINKDIIYFDENYF